VPVAEQTRFAQQGWPEPPQATQLPALQAVLAAVQRLFAQQGWPEAPQPPQEAAEQVPAIPWPHTEPAATQVALSS
jgi:hypothetical protein